MAEAAGPSTGGAAVDTKPDDEHFVDNHQSELIKRVSNVQPILDELLRQNVIQQESYDKIKTLPTAEEKMRELISGPLKSSGVQGKDIFYEILSEMKPLLIQHLKRTEEQMKTPSYMITLLLETLKDLNDAEFKRFKEELKSAFDLETDSDVSLMQQKAPDISMLLTFADMQHTVCLMVSNYDQESVEMTKVVLEKMERTDLVQRLSDRSPRPKNKPSIDEQSALLHKVVTMGTIKELLLKTLNDLSYEERKNFKWFLQFTFFQRSLPQISWSRLLEEDMAESLVDVMVEKYGQKSVEVTREVLMDMNRTDLVQRLSETSSGLEAAAGSSAEVFGVNTTEKEKHSVEEDCPALIQKVTSMESVIELLLETLKDLSDADLKEFIGALLSQPEFHRPFLSIPLTLLQTAHVQDTVFLMVQIRGQKCVKKTEKILKTMKRTDLVQRLSYSSSGSKKKHSADEHRSALIHKVATIAAVQQLLLETLNDLSKKQLKKFKNILQSTVTQKNLPDISWMFHYREDIVNEMVHTYGQQSVELTREVFMDMKRTDLVQRLSKPSSGLKEKHSVGFLSQRSKETGPSRSLEHDNFGSAMQDSSDWTKLEPEVNSTDANEAPTYSLQSEAGSFECSVSGLRWVCKEKVSLKYQFCPWEEPMERMEIISYMPAGPLMNIKVTAGKLDEAYLPHWICIDNNPEIRDKFAVLHIDDCGDVVEKVAEVTSSHVKLSEPHFSPLMVLVKLGCSVDINCYMLIYKTNKAFLTLHVYLIPCDPGLKEELDNRQIRKGYQIIEKSYPETPLRMKNSFILTAGLDSEEIDPEKLMLRYNRNPNFFEVHIKNANTDFKLMLRRENKCEPVRTCTIRKGDYQSAAHIQDAAPADQPSVLPHPTHLSAAEGGEVKQTGLRSSRPGSSDNKHSVDEHLSELMQEGATITTDRERLLNVLENLKQEEFEKFKWFLEDSGILKGLPRIPHHRLEKGNMLVVVNLMVQTYGQQSVELTKKVFQKIPRNDLVKML